MQPITDHNYGVVMCPLTKYKGGLQLFYEWADQYITIVTAALTK